MVQRKFALIDYFDTVVHRKCPPELTKKIWSARIKDLFDLRALTVNDIYERRSVNEKVLCHINKRKGFDSEFSSMECYKSLYRDLDIQVVTVEDFCKVALETEISVECSVQYLDLETLEYIKKNKQLGIKNILVSDFYLPRVAFLKFLNILGISDLFDDIFVSSEYLKTKRAGSLYQIVLETLGAKASDCTMYGDNLLADKVEPEKLGIKASQKDSSVFFQRYYEMTKESKVNISVIKSKIYSILKESCPGTIFPEFAFTIFCALKLILSYCEKHHIRKVVFLAREGKYLLPVFNELVRIYCPNHQYETSYLYVSRRSTFLPSLKEFSQESFSSLFRHYPKMSPSEFFRNLNLENFVSSFVDKYPLIDFDKRIDSFADTCFFQTLLRDKEFQSVYNESRNHQFRLFSNYLQQTCGTLEENIALVDVGWKGTIQDNLEKVVEELKRENLVAKDMKLFGLYFGLDAGGDIHVKEGVLFDYHNDSARSYKVFSENRTLFETILAADHGSTVAYRCQPDSSMVEPVLAQMKEEELFFTQLRPMLDKYVNSCSLIGQVLSLLPISDSDLKTICMDLHSRMVLYPSSYELDWFDKLFHEENFGVYSDSFYSIKKEKSRIKKIINGISAIIKRKAPIRCLWPYQYIAYCCGQPFVTLYRLYKRL